jgi:hypothetical protein
LGLTASAEAWIENGDAGDGVSGNFQVIDNSQGATLTQIIGSTDDQANDFVDTYLLTINNPGIFAADTLSGSNFDTMLYLFDVAGLGLLANDDVSGVSTRSRLVATSNDGTGISVGVGTYILAVTGFQMDAVDLLNQALFDIPIGDVTQISGPDGAGGANALGGWEDNTVLGDAATGDYLVTLTGVGPVPAPGVMAIFGGAGALAARRRRRN